jgi:hypothetical protein
MRVECPYCALEVDVTGLAAHVESEAGGGHGPQGTVPVEDVDSPWNLRLDVSSEDAPGATESGEPSARVVEESLRGGRCPNCKRGVVGLKGGEGLLSRGHRRVACPNCGWESPEWVQVDR